MASYTLPHFGKLDPQKLDEYYDVDIEFNGHEVGIDLNFDGDSIDPKRLDIAKHFIENIAALDAKNKQYIKDDYADEDGDTVKLYITHHLEEIDKTELSDLVDFEKKDKSPDDQLLGSLHLVRMGLYPDNEEDFAIFDYSIGRELTQYLVVININETGDLTYLTMES